MKKRAIMGKNKKKDELWKEACKKCRLSTKHIQITKEFPKTLVG